MEKLKKEGNVDIGAPSLLKRSLEDVIDEIAPPRKRGRPPKKQKIDGEDKSQPDKPPRRRGAGKKKMAEMQKVDTPTPTLAITPQDPKPAPRRRGRGKKTIAAEQAVTAVVQTPLMNTHLDVTESSAHLQEVRSLAGFDDERLGEKDGDSQSAKQLGPSNDTSSRAVSFDPPLTALTTRRKRRTKKSAEPITQKASPEGTVKKNPLKRIVKSSRKRQTSAAEPPQSKRTKNDAAGNGGKSPVVPATSSNVDEVPEKMKIQPASSVKERNIEKIESDDATKTDRSVSELEIPSTLSVDGVSVELESLDVDGNENYGSLGGMLAMGRQQVVLELLSEHGGVFPSGNELRHAFNKRYLLKNPKAGQTDRRLIRGVVQSLQYKGKINQMTFVFTNTRGLKITKKIVVDASMPLDSPLVVEMTRNIIAADGNLWFPAGVELHADIAERVRQPAIWSLPRPKEIEDVEFERMIPESTRLRQEERAAVRAKKIADREKRRKDKARFSAFGFEFSEEQKEAARVRRAQIKADRALAKLNLHYLDELAIGAVEKNICPAFPKSLWWNDFVGRDSASSTDATSFFQQIEDIQTHEQNAQKAGGETKLIGNELALINHFAPETVVGQAPVVNLDHCISSIKGKLPKDVYRKSQVPSINPEWRVAPVTNMTVQAVPVGSTDHLDEPDDRKMQDMFAVRRKPRRRAPGTTQKAPSRRDQQMAKLRQNTFSVGEEPMEDTTPGIATKVRNRRGRYKVAKEDEETLLMAVTVLRTLFGGGERRLHWGVIQKALPHTTALILQKGWPRVRDAQKRHLKRLQAEFEEMYLEAYAKGELPVVNLSDVWSFDLPYHVNWFRSHLRLPDVDGFPELASKREVFESLYDIEKEETNSWRNCYHNPALTMGNRANHFVCYAYESPLNSDNIPPSPGKAIEYVESIIKVCLLRERSESTMG